MKVVAMNWLARLHEVLSCGREIEPVQVEGQSSPDDVLACSHFLTPTFEIHRPFTSFHSSSAKLCSNLSWMKYFHFCFFLVHIHLLVSWIRIFTFFHVSLPFSRQAARHFHITKILPSFQIGMAYEDRLFVLLLFFFV